MLRKDVEIPPTFDFLSDPRAENSCPVLGRWLIIGADDT